MKRIVASQIWSEFQAMMDHDPPLGEECFHQYMVRHPALIPVWDPLGNTVYSKFPLGAEYVTDFAYVRDDTPGLRWGFIEIEKPSDRLLLKNGQPSSRLSQALNQLHSWHQWFQNNREYVRLNLPHGDRAGRIGLAEPHLILVMGRRSKDLWEQRGLLQRHGGGVQVRTFDGLQRNLEIPSFARNEPIKCVAHSAAGWDRELSQMTMEVSYYIE